MTESKPIKDSGERREFSTGAVRDIQEGKGCPSVMPLDVVARLMNDQVIGKIALFQEFGAYNYLIEALDEFIENNGDCESMMLDVAKHFEQGMEKYGRDNWRKGIPTDKYVDSMCRHYWKFLRLDKDENHDRAFVWNVLCCIWTCIHKPELNTFIENHEQKIQKIWKEDEEITPFGTRVTLSRWEDRKEE